MSVANETYPPLFCSAGDFAQAKRDVAEHGMPTTPARFQRTFRWGYIRASDAFLAVGRDFEEYERRTGRGAQNKDGHLRSDSRRDVK